MHTRAHLGRVAMPRATSRLDALLDDIQQTTLPRPRPGGWRKYRQRSHWKSILRQIVKEGIGQAMS
jgi:hypothetical protein